MRPTLQFLLCVSLFVGAGIFFAQFFWRWIIRYRITNSSIEVVLFGCIPISKTLFPDILEVRSVSFNELLPWKNLQSVGWYRLGNRVWGDGVLIRRRRGMVRRFVISPDEPRDFVNELNRKVDSQRRIAGISALDTGELPVL